MRLLCSGNRCTLMKFQGARIIKHKLQEAFYGQSPDEHHGGLTKLKDSKNCFLCSLSQAKHVQCWFNTRLAMRDNFD